METRASYVTVGAFVLTLIAGAVLFVLWFSRFDFGVSSALYDIYFEGSVSGLRMNEDVRYHGIPIGKIKHIEVDRKNFNRVLVRVSIDKPSLVREDVTAIIEAQGLTGYTYVQLQGGSKTSPKLKAKEGERYPVIPSQPSKIEMLFSDAPLLLSSIYHLSEQLNDLFDAKNRKQIDALIVNLTTTSDALAHGQSSLKEVLEEARVTLKDFKERFAESSADFKDTGAAIQKTSDALQKAATQVEHVMADNREAVRDFTNTSLPELSRTIKSAKATLDEVQKLTQQLNKNPAQLFKKSTGSGYQLKDS